MGKDLEDQLLRADAVFVPDKEVKVCQAVGCKTVFSLTTRRHHCRYCGMVMCARHAPEEPVATGSPLNRKGVTKARRCNSCHLPPVLRAYRHTRDGPLNTEPANVIMSYLDDRSINALLQSCTAVQRTFHVRDVPYFEDVTTRFPHLRQEAQVGKGGCGTVFKIEDRDRGNRRIAVKTVAKKSIFSYALWRRLFTEVSILRDNDHPNVAAVLEVFQTKSELVMVMECGEGGTLTRAVEVLKLKRLPIEPFVGHVVGQVAAGLKYLFERGIVHRDIKADNLVLSADFSRVMIIDFGLAERVSVGRKQSFVPCGTIGFASPLNILAVVERKQRFFADAFEMMESDIFSLGVVAYMLFTGQKPLRGTRFIEQHAEVKRGLRCSGQRWGGIGRDARDLVERMLATETEARATPDDIVASKFVRESAEGMRAIIDAVRKDLALESREIEAEFVLVDAESDWAFVESIDGGFMTRKQSHVEVAAGVAPASPSDDSNEKSPPGSPGSPQQQQRQPQSRSAREDPEL